MADERMGNAEIVRRLQDPNLDQAWKTRFAAADAIERLEAQLKSAREALGPFAKADCDMYDEVDANTDAFAILNSDTHITVGDLRRARAALTGGE